MTTTVKRGAGRPAGAARTTKAAQNTPLPGDEPAAPELPAKAAPRRRGKETPEPAGKPASDQPEAPPGASSRSRVKADRMAADLQATGWENTLTEEGDRTELVSTRGTEKLKQVWEEGRWIYRETRYTNGDRASKPRNASAVRKSYATR